MNTKSFRSSPIIDPKGGLKATALYNLLLLVLLITILTVRILLLVEIPAGLFLDEASIGYNAVTIGATGVDEHGVQLPVYFESVGDYKNPVFIYAAAVMFRIFGVSEFILRFTSTVFYISTLAFTILLIARLFRGNKAVEMYALISFGFLPLFFVLSRIAFEVISQLTWIAALNLLIWMNFHQEGNNKFDTPKAIVCGFILGSSIYTYSTARLLTFLTLAAIWFIYFKRENLKKLLLITASAAISLIPFAVFTIKNPGAITSRFQVLSYTADSIPLTEKLGIFVQNYFTYLSPDFLILHGDPNLRHSTGHGGVIYITTLLLFAVGLISIVAGKKLGRFNLFLIVMLLFSPIPAALTSEGMPHALRSMLLGYYILLISCYGWEAIASIHNRPIQYAVISCISLLLLFEISSYQLDYFLEYPSRSVEAMGSFDLNSSLQVAIDQNPREIIFVNEPRVTYANMQFYSLLVKNPGNIPITASDQPEPAPGTCFVYNRRNENMLNQSPYPFYELDSLIPNMSAAFFQNTKPITSIIKVRCYKNTG